MGRWMQFTRDYVADKNDISCEASSSFSSIFLILLHHQNLFQYKFNLFGGETQHKNKHYLHRNCNFLLMLGVNHET